MSRCFSLAVMATMVTRMPSPAAGGSAQTHTAGMTTATRATRLLRAASGAVIGTNLLTKSAAGHRHAQHRHVCAGYHRVWHHAVGIFLDFFQLNIAGSGQHDLPDQRRLADDEQFRVG